MSLFEDLTKSKSRNMNMGICATASTGSPLVQAISFHLSTHAFPILGREVVSGELAAIWPPWKSTSPKTPSTAPGGNRITVATPVRCCPLCCGFVILVGILLVSPGIVKHLAAIGSQGERSAQAPGGIREDADLETGGSGEQKETGRRALDVSVRGYHRRVSPPHLIGIPRLKKHH